MSQPILSKSHQLLIRKIKTARKKAGLNQSQAAKLLKKSQSFISKIESGQRKVHINQLTEFSRIYKKSVKYFIVEGGGL